MKISLAPARPKNIPLIRLVEGGERASPYDLVIGNRREMTRRRLTVTIRKVIARAKELGLRKIAIRLNDFVFPHLAISRQDLAEHIAVNCLLANYEFVYYKTRPKEGWHTVQEAVVIEKGSDKEVKESIRRGIMIGNEINECRTLGNTRAADLTPARLAEAATQAALGTSITIEILGKKEMEKLMMGGVLAVAKGSVEEPRFIIMKYLGGGSEQPIVLIGKAVTFDSGGMNLKRDDYIAEMHLDMLGGAAVIHAIVLAAKMKLKKNIIALIPAVENMVSGASMHPGDIVRTMSGTTIEVLNTDAEGRIILADALTYAERFHPRLVIDVATLTSAAVVALGQMISALFTDDDDLAERILKLGQDSGDYFWRLPLWEEYRYLIKSDFADISANRARWGAAIAAALFLKTFVRKYPWAHLDIAPRIWTSEGECLAKGASGTPIRLLIRLLEQY